MSDSQESKEKENVGSVTQMIAFPSFSSKEIPAFAEGVQIDHIKEYLRAVVQPIIDVENRHRGAGQSLLAKLTEALPLMGYALTTKIASYVRARIIDCRRSDDSAKNWVRLPELLQKAANGKEGAAAQKAIADFYYTQVRSSYDVSFEQLEEAVRDPDQQRSIEDVVREFTQEDLKMLRNISKHPGYKGNFSAFKEEQKRRVGNIASDNIGQYNKADYFESLCEARGLTADQLYDLARSQKASDETLE